MNPFEGQRQLEVRAEQVVWHLVSAGVLGLLLLLLVVSVALLDGAQGPAQPIDATPRVARPLEDDGARPATLETSQRRAPAAQPVAVTVKTDPPRARMRVRPGTVETLADGEIRA